MDGWSMDGKTMKMSRMEHTLSGDEICDYVTEQLLTESKLHNLQVNLGGLKVREVQAIQKGGAFQSSKGDRSSSQGSKGGQSPRGQAPHSTQPHHPGKGKNNRKGGNKGGGHNNGGNQGAKTEEKTSTVTPEPPTLECPHCKALGKPTNHAVQQCPEWRPQNIPNDCRTCLRDGRNAKHKYYLCQYWLAERNGWQQNRQQNSPSPGEKGYKGNSFSHQNPNVATSSPQHQAGRGATSQPGAR